MNKEYQSIPGVGRGSARLVARHRIYAGADHLLVVLNTGYTEDYKRVFFRDIRYVLARKSNGRALRCLYAAIPIGLICLLHLAHLPWPGIIGLCVPFVVWLVVNLALGPCCDCFVSTDVQILRLPTPDRLRRMPAFINFLKTRIPAGNPAAAEQPAA